MIILSTSPKTMVSSIGNRRPRRRSRPRRMVSFSDDGYDDSNSTVAITICSVPSLSDLSEAEVKSIWYTQVEFRDMKQSCVKVLRKIIAGTLSLDSNDDDDEEEKDGDDDDDDTVKNREQDHENQNQNEGEDDEDEAEGGNGGPAIVPTEAALQSAGVEAVLVRSIAALRTLREDVFKFGVAVGKPHSDGVMQSIILNCVRRFG